MPPKFPTKKLCDDLGLRYLGSGRHRAVYRRGDWVYKVPLGEWGEYDNYREATLYAKTGGADINGKYARCRVLKNGWLVMEYVEPLHPSLAPKWADFIDCQQVGTNRDGIVVAFDYA